MLHRFEILSGLETFACGFIMLPPRDLASSLGCLLAISFAPQRSNKQSWFASNKYDLGLKIHCDWEQVVVTILYNLHDGDLMIFTSVRTNNSTRLRFGVDIFINYFRPQWARPTWHHCLLECRKDLFKLPTLVYWPHFLPPPWGQNVVWSLPCLGLSF